MVLMPENLEHHLHYLSKISTMKNILINLSLVIFALWYSTVCAQNNWPKEIQLDNGGKIIIYQPQPESFNGNSFSARSAVSIATSRNVDQTFGSIWFDAVLEVDNDSRYGTIESLKIKEAKFPAIKDYSQLQEYSTIIQNDVPRWKMKLSIAELNSSVKQTQQLNDPNLKNDAPNIIYRDKPTTLIIIDGVPKLQLDKQYDMQKVVNSPSTIVLNPDDNLYYLYGGGLWYSSKSILTGWGYIPNLPIRIQQLNNQIQQQISKEGGNNEPNKPSTPTEILVSTSPAELIQTEGVPTYQTVEGTNLLYVDNSLNDIFKDINTQQNYILISGRWYTSTSLNFGWTYVPANELPADFAKIPEGTEKDGVLSSVAGTGAAKEALMDAQIPQTAKIDRRTATTNVNYDGSPIFNPINGTNLLVAENSNITVVKSNLNGMYYAVDNGVWYISNRYDGPWQVSIERPSDVNNIPADNIAYNVKYVNVYDYNADYVYAGYTPGYLGCFVYGPTVVWGTGWHYHSWYRHHYFARPHTWGFGMTYNPWTGWSIGYESGYGLGGSYYDYNPHAHGWFGPRTYHPSYRSWGYNGGYYGRRDVEINHPRINYGRPSNYSVNYPGRVNNHQFYEVNNHNGNLYHHVQGATTSDINHNLVHWNSSGSTSNQNGINKGGDVVYPQISNHSNNVYGRPITKPSPTSPNYQGNNHSQSNIGTNAVDNGFGKPIQQGVSSPNNIGRPRNNEGTNMNHNGFGRPITQPEASVPNNVSTPQSNSGATNVDNSISKPKPQEGSSPSNIGRPRNNEGTNINHNGFGRPITQPEASTPNNISSTPNIPKSETQPTNHVFGRPQSNPNIDRPLARPITRENNGWRPSTQAPAKTEPAAAPSRVKPEPRRTKNEADKVDFNRR